MVFGLVIERCEQLSTYINISYIYVYTSQYINVWYYAQTYTHFTYHINKYNNFGGSDKCEEAGERRKMCLNTHPRTAYITHNTEISVDVNIK